jgi:transketolase
MRRQFPKTIEEVAAIDEKLIVFLGDIGVFGMRNVFSKYPKQIYNIGVLEQATVSMMAGLNIAGYSPVFHSIAPFVVERCLEQLKLDFGYQKLRGNFVSIGGSYDYTALGCSHHSPGDVQALLTIPDFPIMLPGSPKEFDTLFKTQYKTGGYYRLSETNHGFDIDVRHGRANIIKEDRYAKVIIVAVGPMLKMVMESVVDMKVEVLYYSSIFPFDYDLIFDRIHDKKVVVIVSDLYKGTISPFLYGCNNRVFDYSLPVRFLDHYGTKEEVDIKIYRDSDSLRGFVKGLL